MTDITETRIIKSGHLSLFYFILFLIFPLCVQAQTNLVRNPSFEETGANNTPLYWEGTGYLQQSDISKHSIDTANPHSGRNSGLIENINRNHSYYLQNVRVHESSIYRYSGWIRTESVDEQHKGAGISIKDKWQTGGDFRGTNENWKYVEVIIITGKGITTITLMLTLGFYAEETTGKAWFDDISLVKMDALPEDVLNIIYVENPPDKFQQTISLIIISAVLLFIAVTLYIVFLRFAKKKLK